MYIWLVSVICKYVWGLCWENRWNSHNAVANLICPTTGHFTDLDTPAAFQLGLHIKHAIESKSNCIFKRDEWKISLCACSLLYKAKQHIFLLADGIIWNFKHRPFDIRHFNIFNARFASQSCKSLGTHCTANSLWRKVVKSTRKDLFWIWIIRFSKLSKEPKRR